MGITLDRATTTLSDLCSSSFGQRRTKRKRGDGPKPVSAAEAAATKAKNKEAAALKARANALSERPKSGGPQVEIINGKIVVRESSLVVNNGSSAPVDYEEVEEGIHPTATYSSFSKRIYSSPWGVEETRRFYESLRMCGTDFSMLQVFFPGRTRQQLKSKFFREEEQHPELIKCALEAKLPLDLSPFELHMTGLTETVNISNAAPSASQGQKRTRGKGKTKVVAGGGAEKEHVDTSILQQLMNTPDIPPEFEGGVGDGGDGGDGDEDLVDV
jgi:hypothetical protein